MDLSTWLYQVSIEGHLGATSGPNPEQHPLRVDPTRPFPPPGAGGFAVREGSHTPETRAASSNMPQHQSACMRGRCDAPVALLPPGPPSRLTLERLTTRSSPLTSHGRALTSGPLHPVVSGRPRGTPGSNIWAKPTAKSTPCRPDAVVSPLQVPAAAPSVRGATHRRRVRPLRTCHNTTPHV